jgi:glycosyltransferase involved in cell wall biosynthesis
VKKQQAINTEEYRENSKPNRLGRDLSCETNGLLIMRILYHHRTRGDGAEGIHIGEIVSAFESLGHQIKLAGPWAKKKKLGLSRSQANLATPKNSFQWLLLFKQTAELLYNAVCFLRVFLWALWFRPAFMYERYSAFNCGGILAAALLKLPVVLEVNATYAGKFGCRFHAYYPNALKFCEKTSLTNASVVVVVSNALRTCVIEQGVVTNRILVLPNAINELKCKRAEQAAEQNRPKLRTNLGIESDFVIGFVGSLRRWHGIDFLIQAIPDIIQACPSAQFLIIGSGEMEADFKDFVKRQKLAKKIILHPAVNHDAVFDYLSIMTIGLMPDSNQFGSPMKILEYMSMGVVPVAPDLAPIHEIVEDRVNGMIFKQRNQMEFVDVISTMYNDPEMRLSFAKNGIEYVKSHRLWRINAEKTLEAIAPYLRHPQKKKEN